VEDIIDFSRLNFDEQNQGVDNNDLNEGGSKLERSFLKIIKSSTMDT
jgi:hypothetical protein